MFIIMVYDVNIKRVFRVLKIGRQFLNWVQNSVLEGEITQANFEKLKIKLNKVINKEEDSIVFYTLRTTEYLRKENLGKVKSEPDNIII
ncbi:MAG: CRISPR-associated endonuclease Cas2 [candidate division WOR-3 bacterium]|nr:CRISPR-associated endonuclease Cas2 [candidate division WOR-3 bacterium]